MAELEYEVAGGFEKIVFKRSVIVGNVSGPVNDLNGSLIVVYLLVFNSGIKIKQVAAK